jgi:hypothetical protein
MCRFAFVFVVFAGPMVVQTTVLPAQDKLPATGAIPSSLVTAKTKQVFRFHFSGLQPADAIALAQKVWPIVAKLPEENPLRKAVLQAKDVASFTEVYRSLRSIFLDSGIDTLYFLAEGDWVEMTTLPGYVVIPGTEATLKRLRNRLEAAGHTDWAKFLVGFHQEPGGWMVFGQGTAAAVAGSSAVKEDKEDLVEHALAKGKVCEECISAKMADARFAQFHRCRRLATGWVLKSNTCRVTSEVKT